MINIKQIKMATNIFISCKESRIENNRSFYGCFTLGPFNAGQSLTVANALRRTLLSECPGLGIISVTIENVSHEYSTLPGMRESVLDLLLNLKEVVLKKRKNSSFYLQPNSLQESNSLDNKKSTVYSQIGSSFFKPVSGFLKVKGPGVIRAKDLKLPPFIECVDPEQYIATLAEDGFLCMKFIIMEGKGYFIQKKNSYIDDKVIKNRIDFLYQLTNAYSSTSWEKEQKASFFGDYHSSEGKKDKAKTSSLALEQAATRESFAYDTQRKKNPSLVPFSLDQQSTQGLSQNKAFVQQKALLPIKREEDGNINVSRATSNSEGKGKKNISSQGKGTQGKKKATFVGLAKSKDFNFLEEKKNTTIMDKFSNTLNLDTIFNPVTKISYMIEDFDNKVTNDSNQNLNFIDDVCSLIESSHYLKQSFPLLANNYKIEQKQRVRQSNQSNELANKTQNIMRLIESYNTSDIKKISSSLHPLKKESPLHTIVLEIWTNGSLHPREALSIAIQNLTSTFLTMQKKKIYSSLYTKEASYLCLPLSSIAFAKAKSSNIKEQSKNPTLLEQKQTKNTLGTANSSSSLNKQPSIGLLQGKPFTQQKPNDSSAHVLLKDKAIEFLNLPLRPYTLLKRKNINKISDLCNLTLNELEFIFSNYLNKPLLPERKVQQGVNKKYVTLIINVLKKNGLSLKENNFPIS